MSQNEEGKLAIPSVHLYPQIIFGKDYLPTQEQIEVRHEEAHHSCFLAGSVKAAVIIEKVGA